MIAAPRMRARSPWIGRSVSFSPGVYFATLVLAVSSWCASCASAPVTPAAVECPAPAPCPPQLVQGDEIEWTGPPWFEPCEAHLRELSHLFRQAEKHSVRVYVAGLRVYVEALTNAVEIDKTGTDADKQHLLSSCEKELRRLAEPFMPPPADCQACRLESPVGPGVVSLQAPR